jgi:hypothetical protein
MIMLLYTPSAAPRRCWGNVAEMMTSGCGASMAAPRPWKARAAMSSAGLRAAPHSAENTANTASPSTNMRRCPKMSPSRLMVISSEPKTSR